MLTKTHKGNKMDSEKKTTAKYSKIKNPKNDTQKNDKNSN